MSLSRPVRIVIAPDKWKGCQSSTEAAETLAEVMGDVFPQAVVSRYILADGGEGTVEAALLAPGAERRVAQVRGARGQAVRAEYALLADGTGVLEMASAAGYDLAKAQGGLDPWLCDTYGVGELMLAAVAAGAQRLAIGLGGSATNDGGTGLARALGWTFGGVSRQAQGMRALVEDWDGTLTPPDAPFPVPVTALCDVAAPLLGPTGSTAVFGPQKGVTPQDRPLLESGLERVAAAVGGGHELRRGVGAAGGTGYGLVVFAGGTLQSGSEVLMALSGLEGALLALEPGDLVVTGEGCLDAQSLTGKGPHALARLARAHGISCVAVVGASRLTVEEGAEFDLVIPVTPPGYTFADAVAQVRQLTHTAVLAAGKKLRSFGRNP